MSELHDKVYLLHHNWKFVDGQWFGPHGWPDGMTFEEAIVVQENLDMKASNTNGEEPF